MFINIKSRVFIGAARATVLHEEAHQLEAIPKPSLQVPSLSHSVRTNIILFPISFMTKFL